MAFWTSRKRHAHRELPLWRLASGGRGTLTCVLNQQEGTRVTLVVVSEALEVAACTHQTRSEAIAHASFLLDRFVASGWQVVSGMGEAPASPTPSPTIRTPPEAAPPGVM